MRGYKIQHIHNKKVPVVFIHDKSTVNETDLPLEI